MDFESGFTHIVGASYAGDPQSNTVMFVTKKVERLLSNLASIQGCLVFVEQGTNVPDCARVGDNTFIETDNPQLDYARFIDEMTNRECEFDGQYPPVLTEGGYYLSSKAQVGESVHIEPGAFIYGDVELGDGVEVHSGAVIRHADIGPRVVVKSNACIGDQSFNFAKDEQGNLVRISSVGRVCIREGAEIGCLATVCRGMAGDTVIGDFSKLDDHVHIAHDVQIGSNTELAAGVIVGGYCSIGSSCFIGINSSLKNRIKVGDNVFVGMGAVVARNVKSGLKVFGNPAKKIDV